MVFQTDGFYNWQGVNSSTPQPIILVNRGAYQCEGTPSDPPIIFILPVTCFKGVNFKIIGNGRKFKVLQNANQRCNLGETFSTLGATGYFESKKGTDIIQCQCSVQNTNFYLHDVQGEINLM